MTDPHAEARGLAELQQMCDAPSDAYSAGEWCFAANQLVRIVADLSAREERLRDIERAARILDAAGPNWTWSEWKDSGMAAALSTPEADE